MQDRTPEISIVVATKSGGDTLAECLQQLDRQAATRRVEIIVVDGSRDGVPGLRRDGSTHTVVTAAPESLVPQLWSLGIERASAPIVALTIGQCVPHGGWIEAILETAEQRATTAGFGGSVDPPRDGRWRDWALYFSRYSAYMPPVGNVLTDEIAGDNAAYRMAALRQCDQVPAGFWENLVHHQLRALGWTLSLAPAMRVTLGRSPGAWLFCRERYRHGRYFGSTRPGRSLVTRAMRLATAPLLAPFLIARIGARVASHRRDWLYKYVMALPWLVLFVGSWSAGEAAGYLDSRPAQP